MISDTNGAGAPWAKHFVASNNVSSSNSSFDHDLGVFIGRFQPFHRGHLHVIVEALKKVRHLAILVGSANQPRNYFNPFTFEERRFMIGSAIPQELRDRVRVLPLEDMTYNDGAWVVQVQEKAAEARASIDYCGPKTALVGHQKDGSSFYLRMFPQWDSIGVSAYGDVSATDIREEFFLNKSKPAQTLNLALDRLPVNDEDVIFLEKQWVRHLSVQVPPAVAQILANFRFGGGTGDLGWNGDFRYSHEAYQQICNEYEYVAKYKKQFEGLAYPPIFQTVDAVVVQSGHILLVKRKSYPGKGLWALPGGFLNATERVQDAVYRELIEETKIKVPEPVLKGSTVTSRLFDEVHRSARGRTLTHAFLIHLRGDEKLPRVKGADDAEKARWVPLSEVRRDMMFEDHYSIIKAMTALI